MTENDDDGDKKSKVRIKFTAHFRNMKRTERAREMETKKYV